MKRITELHKQDYAELVELVKSSNLVEFKKQVTITNEDDEYIDFIYRSILATIDKGNSPRLTGYCCLHNEDNTWIDGVTMSRPVDLCGLAWGELAELGDKFEEQVKEKGITFESEDDETGCRLDFIEQYERFGIANPQIRLV